MRPLSPALREALNERETGEVGAVLLTITHRDLAQPMRFSSDPTVRLSDDPLRYGTISRGAVYFFFPFEITLPDDVGERAPTAQIIVSNIDRTLVSMVRAAPLYATVTIELVLASSPDVVEIAWPAFELQAVNYDAESMTLDLAIDALTDIPYPAGTFAPSGFPGLF